MAVRRALVLTFVCIATGCAADSVDPRVTDSGGDARRGEAAIVRFGCGACHTIPGVRRANGLVGPPLNRFTGRSFIAGALPNEPNGLTRWIVDPQSVEPGTTMPVLGVSEPQARDMAAYLYTLR
jgi:cytochrome c2